MSKNNVGKNPTQGKLFVDPELLVHGFDIGMLIEDLKLDLRAKAASAGVQIVHALMEAEVRCLTKKRYCRESDVYLWGKQPGYIILDGQKVPIVRPRLRTGKKGGCEYVPTSYASFQEDGDLQRSVFAKAMAHVSCRAYKESIETLQEGYGISKSAVSRDLVAATAKQLDALLHQPLSDFDITVLVIDGIVMADTVFLCALGVDAYGKKRFLGFLEGATENAQVCKQLLEDLRERGLGLNRPLLALLDGSKALSRAVRDVCGETVVIQRCQEHKIRNVLVHLPKQYQTRTRRQIRAAYKMNSYADAYRALRAIIRELDGINETAARSLEEGLAETLTLHRLNVPNILRRSLSTTNVIESAFSRSRDVMRNVKRWRTHNQKARWLVVALQKAEQSFHAISGFRLMPVLISALQQCIFENKDQRPAA